MDQAFLANKIRNGETVDIEIDGNTIELNEENLLVTMEGLSGYAFSGEGELGVVLDTEISPELKEEGNVREIISKVQMLRKEKDFEVADRIEFYIDGDKDILDIVKKYEEYISKEVLSENILYNQEFENEKIDINGNDVYIGLKVIK